MQEDQNKTIRNLIYKVKGKIEKEDAGPNEQYYFKFKYINKTFHLVHSKLDNTLEISTGILFSPVHQEPFLRLEKKEKIKLVNSIRQIILNKHLEHGFEINPNKTFFEMKYRLFFKKSISTNTFYNSVQLLASVSELVILKVQEFFGEDIKLEEIAPKEDKKEDLYS